MGGTYILPNSTEARREIGHDDDAPEATGRTVPHAIAVYDLTLLGGRDLLVEVDRESTTVQGPRRRAGRKTGSTIDARPGCPDDPATPMIEGRHVTVADEQRGQVVVDVEGVAQVVKPPAHMCRAAKVRSAPFSKCSPLTLNARPLRRAARFDRPHLAVVADHDRPTTLEAGRCRAAPRPFPSSSFPAQASNTPRPSDRTRRVVCGPSDPATPSQGPAPSGGDSAIVQRDGDPLVLTTTPGSSGRAVPGHQPTPPEPGRLQPRSGLRAKRSRLRARQRG